MLNELARFTTQRVKSTRKKWHPSNLGGAMKILERQIHGHTREQQKRAFPESEAQG
jgi:hypothetical protein